MRNSGGNWFFSLGVSFVRRVAIAGVGCTKVGELWNRSLKELAVESALKAMDDARIGKIDFVYVGNAFSPVLQGQVNLGSILVDSLGFKQVSAVCIEAADASGGLAFHEGFKAVKFGYADVVLITGVEKMSDTPSPEAFRALMACEDQEYVAYTGINQAGLHALILRLYMEKFRVEHEEVAMFAVNAHKNSSNNVYAQFRNPLTVEDVLNSPLLADPLRLLESSTLADGSASVVLCPLEMAEKIIHRPIEVLASQTATDKLFLTERDNILTFDSTRVAAEKAFEEAHITRSDVNVVEIHDTSTILGVISLEDLGFVEKGKGASFVAEGNIAVDGRLPTNTMGGLKGRGHPASATGIYQIVELSWQLRGDAGKNQVKHAEIGLAHNMGGVGSQASVTILRSV